MLSCRWSRGIRLFSSHIWVRHMGTRPMNLIYTFRIEKTNLEDFIDHWSSRYFYKGGEKYTDNIGKPLTEKSRRELFEWKNGSKLSAAKLKSVEDNYPLAFTGNQQKRYLNYQEGGGAIWNIFYLHCLDHGEWPIFDQHTYRAMRYLEDGVIEEIGRTNKQKYEAYSRKYMPFVKSLAQSDSRKTDKALFAFGQFLKVAARYA